MPRLFGSAFGGAVAAIGLSFIAASYANSPGANAVADKESVEPSPCRRGSDYVPVPLVADPNVPRAPQPTRKKYLPQFPEHAVDRVKHAELKILVHIAEDGIVKRVEIISENPRGCGFAESTIAAVRSWRFETAEPGTYWMTMKFNMQ